MGPTGGARAPTDATLLIGAEQALSFDGPRCNTDPTKQPRPPLALRRGNDGCGPLLGTRHVGGNDPSPSTTPPAPRMAPPHFWASQRDGQRRPTLGEGKEGCPYSHINRETPKNSQSSTDARWNAIVGLAVDAQDVVLTHEAGRRVWNRRFGQRKSPLGKRRTSDVPRTPGRGSTPKPAPPPQAKTVSPFALDGAPRGLSAWGSTGIATFSPQRGIPAGLRPVARRDSHCPLVGNPQTRCSTEKGKGAPGAFRPTCLASWDEHPGRDRHRHPLAPSCGAESAPPVETGTNARARTSNSWVWPSCSRTNPGVPLAIGRLGGIGHRRLPDLMTAPNWATIPPAQQHARFGGTLVGGATPQPLYRGRHLGKSRLLKRTVAGFGNVATSAWAALAGPLGLWAQRAWQNRGPQRGCWTPTASPGWWWGQPTPPGGGDDGVPKPLTSSTRPRWTQNQAACISTTATHTTDHGR
ncbi:MAG: hypothetical protein CM15mP18_2340 [Methanobacteriota archaeon]|nr:MAG: hypothetical protein CM15mP18_2340 [Euryarchaeota archaeon]